jgi:hypothetical protein
MENPSERISKETPINIEAFWFKDVKWKEPPIEMDMV